MANSVLEQTNCIMTSVSHVKDISDIRDEPGYHNNQSLNQILKKRKACDNDSMEQNTLCPQMINKKPTGPKSPRSEKRQKTSYFNDDDSFLNDPDPDNKIVFLVSDKPEILFDDDFWKKMFGDDEIDPMLDLLNSKDPKITTKTPSKPPSKKRTRRDTPPNSPKPILPLIPLIPIKPNNNIFIPPLFLDSDFGDDSCDKPRNPPKKSKTKSNPDTILPIDCKNPLCNHKTLEEDPSAPTLIDFPQIKSIDDLIAMGKAFHCKKQTTYRGLNLRLMNNLVAPLTEMNGMVGLESVKKHMVDQILFFLQGFNTTEKCNNCQDCSYGLPCIQSNTEMLHTVILGPPGVGKTCMARIVGKVYKAMGILSNGEFHEVTRTDFVAGYLGQTAIKTQKLIDACQGGVMFIDEAYSLGNKEKRDSFSKEALDTLNKNLSDKRDFLCIITGYEKDLEECFFSFNEGLKRRFTFRYKAEAYNHEELFEIFKLKVKMENWTIDLNSDLTPEEGSDKYSDDDVKALFRNNKDRFPYQGGDIETLFLQSKICHGRRIPLKRKCLSFSDIKDGFDQFVNNRKHKKVQKNDEEEKRPNMYKL